MIVDKYLNYLNERKNEHDPSLPNPYDYQSLELDPNVTKQDLKTLGGWLKKNKEFLHPDFSIEPVEWLYITYREGIFRRRKISTTQPAFPYIIIDNGKRVGIVSYVDNVTMPLTWASWVPGHNYAVRGTMKLLDLMEKTVKYKPLYRFIITTIYEKNKASMKVAEKLKMRTINCYNDGDCTFRFDKGTLGWWRK